MTISTPPAPLSYNGDGATTAFAITWKFFSKGDVVVTLRDSSAVETTWVESTNYTLSAANVDTGGTLTAITVPATGETLVIELEPANTQDSSLPVGGAFASTVVEDELDKAVQRDGKFQALMNRSLRVPKTDTQTGALLELPIDSSRADKFLAFDSNGKLIAAAGTSANLKAVSAFVDTLLDDADAATFLTTLGITAYAQTILDDANAGTALTTLGITAYAQTVLDDADAITARATLGVSDVGDLSYSWAATKAGWLLVNGQTVGSAASVATDKSDDYEALFKFVWDNVADAQAAVSTGRGASAQADWDADETITLPDGRGRMLLGKDNMGGSSANVTADTEADTIGDVAGDDTVTQTSSTLVAHTHTYNDFSAVGSNAGLTGGANYGPVASGSAGSGVAMDTMNPYMTVNLFIRY